MTLANELTASSISMQFGGLQALNDVSLTLRPGEIMALIGPNGAGKTTMINIISGAQRPTSGTVSIDGVDITRERAERRNSIARTFQIAQVFKGMSVLENVMVGLHAQANYGVIGALFPGVRTRRAEARLTKSAHELLESLGIDHLSARDAGTLPLGQERLLELARALATRPSVVLLDEAASGLTAPDRVAMAARVRTLRDEGYAVLLVEHNMRFVKETADNVVVLNFGGVIFDGSVDDGLADQRVIEAYLGTPDKERKS